MMLAVDYPILWIADVLNSASYDTICSHRSFEDVERCWQFAEIGFDQPAVFRGGASLGADRLAEHEF